MRARFFEDASASGSLKGPLVGIKAVPLVSLKVAIEALRGGAHDIVYNNLLSTSAVLIASTAIAPVLSSGKYPTMSVDEAAAIHLYTMQTPLYRTLNAALRNENAAAIAPFMKYIKLLLTALYKLPIEKCTVYRGIRDPPAYNDGDHLVWWAFSSTTRRVAVTETFLDFVGPRAMLVLENAPCVNIEDFSFFGPKFPGDTNTESERLLLPGTALKVLSVSKEFDNGRRNVQMEFIKGQAVFDFMHPEWPLDLFSAPKK
jgi:hypothetical protein